MFYNPRKRSLGKVIFLHLFVILFTGGEYLIRYTPRSRHPPPRTRCTPRADTPPGPGTPPGSRPSLGADTPLGPGTPPQDQVHTPPSRACWQIRSTCGRSASYWNAILLNLKITLHSVHLEKLCETFLTELYSFVGCSEHYCKILSCTK